MPKGPLVHTDCWGDVSPLMASYHDHEWGVPIYDDRALWEKLELDGFQAGLSWSTILDKRQNFSRAFEGWFPERIATYGEDDIARLLADPGIVRNRLKVRAAVKNAQAYLALREREGSFSGFLWQFVRDAPVRAAPRSMSDVPATTPESDLMSKALLKSGFTFVGSTIVYAFMQAVGMVNDHIAGCGPGDALRRSRAHRA
jgi:DNA-3-methyladenine glycosylase I